MDTADLHAGVRIARLDSGRVQAPTGGVTFSSPADVYLTIAAPGLPAVTPGIGEIMCISSRGGKTAVLEGAGRWLRRCITIVLDPAGFLTRLATNHICGLHQEAQGEANGGCHPSGMSRQEMRFACN